MTDTPNMLDLDDARAQRLRAKAARRAGRGETQTIRFGGMDIAVVGAEFPLDVLEPFADVNVDLALLVRQALDMASQSGRDSLASLDLIVSVLAANPSLPREVIGAVKESGRRLLGEDGYALFVAARPTPWDVAALLRGLSAWYGVGLGESSSSSEDSGDGATSKPTSEPVSVSTSTPAGFPSVIPTLSA